MRNFWKRCAQESAQNHEIEQIWRNAHDIEDCYAKATKAWQSRPFLTTFEISTCAIWQAMLAKDSFHRSVANAKSSYKIMELVGRFTAVDQWSAACAVACYRASKELSSELSSEECAILDELYERIERDRVEDEELHDVMAFWGRLNDYRESLLQSSGAQSLSPKEASDMLERFKSDQLWHDLTWRQQQSKRWRSTVTTILHKRAGWTHAAKAIMQYGLPKLEQPAQPDDATEHVNALGEFAGDMAQWLLNFASGMHAYKQTEEYQKNYQTSIEALQRKRGSASE